MTIQTTIATDDLIDALKRRSAALMQTHVDLSTSFKLIFRANRGDHDAKLTALGAIFDSVYRLDSAGDDDVDLIRRLRAQLHADQIDWLEHSGIAQDARERSYKIDIRIDKFETERAATARQAENYRGEQQARRSAYTTVYEGAMKLTPRQRRQLAEALLDS